MKTREELSQWENTYNHIVRLQRDLDRIELGNLATVREPEAKELRYRIAVLKAQLEGVEPPVAPVVDIPSEVGVANGLAEGTDINTVFEPVGDRPTTPSGSEPLTHLTDDWTEEEWDEYWDASAFGTIPAPETMDTLTVEELEAIWEGTILFPSESDNEPPNEGE